MIYQAKPQRGGKSIPTNTNFPPQDPPPSPVEIVSPKVTKKVTPKRTVKTPKKAHIVPVIRLSLRQKIFRFLKKIFRRV